MSDDVPWLDDDELAAWMALSAMRHLLQGALNAQLKQDAGLNEFEYLVLASLSEAPDRSRRMSHLAVLAQGSLSRLSHAVSRLEKSGWVVRRPSSEDPRSTEAHLTAAGMRKIRQAAPGHVREVRRVVLDQLTREQVLELGAISRAVLAGTWPEIVDELDTRR